MLPTGALRRQIRWVGTIVLKLYSGKLSSCLQANIEQSPRHLSNLSNDDQIHPDAPVSLHQPWSGHLPWPQVSLWWQCIILRVRFSLITGMQRWTVMMGQMRLLVCVLTAQTQDFSPAYSGANRCLVWRSDFIWHQVCQSSHHWCDGKAHCDNNADELASTCNNCSHPSLFRCPIYRNQVQPCHKIRFMEGLQCTHLQVCILKSIYFCNGQADCDDASDEISSLCGEDEIEEEELREENHWWSVWGKTFPSPLLGFDW